VLLNAKFLLYNNRERYIYINMDPRGYALSFAHVTGEDPSKPIKKEAAVVSVEKKPSSGEDVAPQGDDKSEDCDLEEALRLSLIQFEEEKKKRQKEDVDYEEAMRQQRRKAEREQKEKVAEREKREKERERVELELKKKAEELRQMLLLKQQEEAERAEALARQKAEKERLERETESQAQVAQLAAKAEQMAINEWACPLCTCLLFLSFPFIHSFFCTQAPSSMCLIT